MIPSDTFYLFSYCCRNEKIQLTKIFILLERLLALKWFFRFWFRKQLLLDFIWIRRKHHRAEACRPWVQPLLQRARVRWFIFARNFPSNELFGRTISVELCRLTSSEHRKPTFSLLLVKFLLYFAKLGHPWWAELNEFTKKCFQRIKMQNLPTPLKTRWLIFL